MLTDQPTKTFGQNDRPLTEPERRLLRQRLREHICRDYPSRSFNRPAMCQSCMRPHPNYRSQIGSRSEARSLRFHVTRLLFEARPHAISFSAIGRPDNEFDPISLWGSPVDAISKLNASGRNRRTLKSLEPKHRIKEFD